MRSVRVGIPPALALGISLIVAGCGDLTEAVSPGPAEPAPFFSVASGTDVEVLHREKPLSRAVSRTRTIGPKGGRIALKKAGVVVEFPEGAVSVPTEITVEAPAGSAVAFEFAPHGLRFDAPVSIRIDTDDLEGDPWEADDGDDGDGGGAPAGGLLGVYFVGDAGLGGVQPLELLGVRLGDEEIILRIEHFSGYALASG